MPLCGGIGEIREPDEKIHNICSAMKPHAEEKTGQKFEEFMAVSFTSQVVAGTNYFIKVRVGGEKHIHIRVFHPLPHQKEPPSLTDLQEDKSLGDPIVYF